MKNSMWKYLAIVVWITVGSLSATLSLPAYAVPSFARQTGMQCATCHTVFPGLTVFGRQFKLRGPGRQVVPI